LRIIEYLERQGCASISMIAKGVRVSSRTAATYVHEMNRMGLVSIQPYGRALFVTLTEKGREFLERMVVAR